MARVTLIVFTIACSLPLLARRRRPITFRTAGPTREMVQSLRQWRWRHYGSDGSG